MDKVDDKLEFVQTFEVRELRWITGGNNRRQPAYQNQPESARWCRRRALPAHQKDRSPSPLEKSSPLRRHACIRFPLPTPTPFVCRACWDFDELRSNPARRALAQTPGAPSARVLWEPPSQHPHLSAEQSSGNKSRSHVRRAESVPRAGWERSVPKIEGVGVALRSEPDHRTRFSLQRA